MSRDAGQGGGAGGGDDGVDITPTKREDYPRLFTTNIGLAVVEGGCRAKDIGERITELGVNLAQASTNKRRAGLLAADAEVGKAIAEYMTIIEKLEDARTILREQYQLISPHKDAVP